MGRNQSGQDVTAPHLNTLVNGGHDSLPKIDCCRTASSFVELEERITCCESEVRIIERVADDNIAESDPLRVSPAIAKGSAVAAGSPSTTCFYNLQMFKTVSVKLHISSTAAGNIDGTSGVEELEFVIGEPDWSRKWQQITSLNEKYMNLWTVHDIDFPDEVDSLQRKKYFPDFEKSFEDVIYPEGDCDAVSISKRDVDLLEPETFVNDTIIDFYIQYLKNQIPPEEKHKYHFFNSFFFRKLADLDKDPSSALDGRAAFLRVRKWTRKVDIFGKNYIFIPVNFGLHWSLLVICHPGEIASFTDGDSEKSPRVPCILHMDSIKGTHAGLKNLVQSYLWEEWTQRQEESSNDVSSNFLNLRFVPLEGLKWTLPIQGVASPRL